MSMRIVEKYRPNDSMNICFSLLHYLLLHFPISLGELTVDCIDPDGQPVNVNLTDNFDGTYRLRVRPVKPGKHILNIRLNKQHVFGKCIFIHHKM